MRSQQIQKLTKSILQSNFNDKQNSYREDTTLFHKPCTKDLRVSYLEQYELNGNRTSYDPEIDRSRTKDALKDITEKYGFEWDQCGKLKKKDYNQNKAPYNVHQKYKQLKSITDQGLKKFSYEEKQIIYEIQNKSYHKQTEDTKNSFFLDQQIDDKINKIWSKYRSYVPCDNHISFRPHQQLNEQIIYPVKEQKSLHNRIIPQKPQQKIQKTQFHFRNIKLQEDLERKSSLPKNLSLESKYRNISKERSPKKYDDKIDEITNKIKKCEQQKDKLKINYKKFDVDTRSKSKSKSKSPFSKNLAYKNHSPLQQFNVPEKSPIKNQYPRQNKGYSKTPNIYKEMAKNQKHSPIFQQQSQNLSKSFSFEENKKQLEINFQNLRKETQEKSAYNGLNIKKRQNNQERNVTRAETTQLPQTLEEQALVSHIIHTNQTKDEQKTVKKQKKQIKTKLNLIQKLLKQIELDEQFRNARAWFYNNQDPHKWGILADNLANKYEIKLNYHQLVQKFQSLPEQRNPFFSTRDCQQNYDTLAASYLSSEEYWKKCILNSFSEGCLEEAGFTSKELDVENKGKLRIQDFVRDLNMKTDCFFRNRDFVLIFARLAGRGKSDVQFSRIVRMLTP